jgi:hypothetical protein
MTARRRRKQSARGTLPPFIMTLAALTLIGGLAYSMVVDGDANKFLVGAVAAIALGGSLGRAADSWVRAYLEDLADLTEEEEDPPHAP